jgi:hypothetical protein
MAVDGLQSLSSQQQRPALDSAALILCPVIVRLSALIDAKKATVSLQAHVSITYTHLISDSPTPVKSHLEPFSVC